MDVFPNETRQSHMKLAHRFPFKELHRSTWAATGGPGGREAASPASKTVAVTVAVVWRRRWVSKLPVVSEAVVRCSVFRT